MTKTGPKPKPVKERLLEHCTVLGDCWMWTGAKNREGYGRINYGGHSKSALAHRIAYTEFVGPIPEGLQLDHLCRNPACINPAHLEAVTNRMNCERGLTGKHGKNGDYWRAKTHCPHGHRYDLINTYWDRHGHRFCRACHREREKLRIRRKNDRAANYRGHESSN